VVERGVELFGEAPQRQKSGSATSAASMEIRARVPSTVHSDHPNGRAIAAGTATKAQAQKRQR